MADQNGLPDGWVIIDTPQMAVSHEQEKPNTSNGLTLAATAASIPIAARVAMESATNPNVPKIMSTVGQIAGGVKGLMHGGPLEAAGGVYVGGKAGWFTGKLMQKMAAPMARAASAAAPYAQTLSTLSGAAGVGDLAQMADPTRGDIGFLGISNAPAPVGPHPPEQFPASRAVNEAVAAIAERMGNKALADKWRAAYNPDATMRQGR